MRTFAVPVSAIAALFLASVDILPAQAQLWVASFGSGTLCTRALPCAAFQVAYDAAPAGGEIRCVDSGQFGSLVIAKSITIDCEENIGTAAFGGTFITINVAASDVVTLKGLDMYGAGSYGSGAFPFIFNGAGLLQLENVKIRGWRGGAGGIRFTPNGPAKLVMSNSTVADNGTGGNILIQPTGGAPVQAMFDGVTVDGSVFGIKAEGGGQASGQIDVEVRDSVVAHHSNNGFIAASNAGQAPIHYSITQSSAFNNSAFGAVATGAQAFMIVGNNSLKKNGTGLAQLNGSTVAIRRT